MECFPRQNLQPFEINTMALVKLDVPLRKIITAAWLAEPPSKRGFSALGVFMESRAVEPTMRTLMLR
jgi:hypothetical protein